METMKESGKLPTLTNDQLVELTASLNFLSSSSSPQALPVKMAAVSRSSTPLQYCDDQQQFSELKPLSLPSANQLSCTGFAATLFLHLNYTPFT